MFTSLLDENNRYSRGDQTICLTCTPVKKMPNEKKKKNKVVGLYMLHNSSAALQGDRYSDYAFLRKRYFLDVILSYSKATIMY